MFCTVRQVAATGGEVCCLRLHLVNWKIIDTFTIASHIRYECILKKKKKGAVLFLKILNAPLDASEQSPELFGRRSSNTVGWSVCVYSV